MPTMTLHRIMFLLFLVILTLGQSCLAAVRSTSQFGTFLTSFEGAYRHRSTIECQEEHARYKNATIRDPPNKGHHIAFNLVNCMLDSMSEAAKAEMALSGVLLALAPASLTQVGPSLSETSFLSMRRPFLALLLGVGTPAPNPSRGNLYSEPVAALANPHGLGHLRVLSRDHHRMAAWVTVLVVEYAIAMAAAGNCIYQTYRLTFNAVPLAPIVVLLPGIPETWVPFGWLLLLVPIHLLSTVSFALAFSCGSPSRPRRPWYRHFSTWCYRLVADELSPCRYGRPLRLKARRDGLWHPFVSLITHFATCAHIMIGTVLLGSVLFITVADLFPLVESYIAAALASRVVLIFELQGMRLAAQEDDKGTSAHSTPVGIR